MCFVNGSSPETKFIQEIIEKISNIKINGMRLFVANYPVGVNSHTKVAGESICCLWNTKSASSWCFMVQLKIDTRIK